MDKGYDNNRVYAECEERGVEPVIPLRGARGKQLAMPIGLGGRFFPRIPRHTQRFRDLYRGRAAVEREFGRLKHDYGLAPLRVRGLERVRLHADLTMLGRLGQALLRAREAVPVAAQQASGLTAAGGFADLRDWIVLRLLAIPGFFIVVAAVSCSRGGGMRGSPIQ